MALTQAIAAGGVQLWKLRLLGRMQALARETGESGFVLPVALLLLADEASGGEIGAAELGQCFALSDFECRNLIDCYFPGWSPVAANAGQGGAGGLRFEVRVYEGFRQALRAAGIREPGDRAGLILVDASHVDGTVRLNFAAAIGIDLAAARTSHQASTVGGLLRSMTDTIAAVKSRDRGGPAFAFTCCGSLGLAVARRSFLGPFLDEWSARPGAAKVAELAMREVGPDLRLLDL